MKNLKAILFWAGVLAAGAAVILGVASADVGIKATVNPLSALGLAAAGFVLLKASELSR